MLLGSLFISGAQAVGVCYGRNGAGLPSDAEVVQLYKANGIGRMRIYDPNPATLQALRGSNIELILDIFKNDLQGLANDAAAAGWVQKNIRAYWPDVKFRYISVGNEVKPGEPAAQFVLPAMKSIQNAISAANLQNQIKVSTAIDTSLLAKSYPPYEGEFSPEAKQYMTPIVQFLAQNGAPLLANVYPYFAHVFNKAQVSLEYALFTSNGVVTPDGTRYQNLFVALMDSVYSAVDKAGAPGLKIVVSESGWPSAGGDPAATPGNAGTYYKNLISHVNGGNGTPKRPQGPIETYLFAMFDENQKPGDEVEKHFGLFSPNKQPKYQLSF